MQWHSMRTAIGFLLGLACGLMLWGLWGGSTIKPTADAHLALKSDPAALIEALKAELEAVKEKLPDQAHAMHDVDYHFANLWFAANKEHWKLADFYLSETRSHLRWAVRIIPKRKDNSGREIDLGVILQAFETTPFKQLQDAIAAKDSQAFVKSYKFTLEICYACHKAADKPFLRPQVPTQPESHIMNFDPLADWPN